ncbi:MAG: ABC transporter ATP-binding protein [bacterium]
MDTQQQDKLVAVNVKKDYWQGGKLLPVLKGINAEFCRGTSYAIIGASGHGKSTLLHILGGLDSATSGIVTFNGQDIFYVLDKENFRNKNLGFVFQFHYLLKELTVRENVMIWGMIAGENKKKCRLRADELLNVVGMSHRADFYPGQLSGGEQQRVSLVRAMFNKPAFLLADEPTGNLDEENAQVIVELLLQGCREWGMGLILCTHDKKVYDKMDKIFRLHNGIFEP